tara:strand:- start:20 stop:1099 length:1080 start_codon:yes stop_codon:yes gene_type:complete
MKKFLTFTYKLIRGLQVVLNKKSKFKSIRVFYGGAIKGNVGGTLVKIKRLNKYFPEYQFSYNIVYLLSNSPYLPLFAMNILKKRNIPIIHNQNGVFYPAWYKGDYKKQNLTMSRQYLNADYIFFQSKFCKDVAEKFLGKSRAKSEILYNAVDTKKFFPLKKEIKKNKFTFLITGKFSLIHYYHLKNTILSIDSINYNNILFKLIIAGTISSKLNKKIYNLIKSYNLKKENYAFLGKYTQDKANIIYNSADAFIYLSHNSPCPNSVIEALSCGLPVLYSNSGGVPELVGLNCGIPLNVKNSFEIPLCPNIDEIHSGIKKIIDNREFFSNNARSRAIKLFDINKWINRHETIFNEFLSKKT